MRRNDLGDRAVPLHLRRTGLAILVALAAVVACGKREAPTAEGGGSAGAPTATSEGGATNLVPGNSKIGEIVIKEATQDFGKPQLNRNIMNAPLSVAGNTHSTGIGTHANSRIRISFPAGYRSLSGACGVDDFVGNHGSVVCRVLDGDRALFRSNLLKGRSPSQTFDVPVSGLTELTLAFDDGGDGNTSDHADWVDLTLHK